MLTSNGQCCITECTCFSKGHGPVTSTISVVKAVTARFVAGTHEALLESEWKEVLCPDVDSCIDTAFIWSH
jgi:hypothetical protein